MEGKKGSERVRGADRMVARLLWINCFLTSLMVLSALLVGIIWSSDRWTAAVVERTIVPRLVRLIEKNPEWVSHVTRNLSCPSLAAGINRRLQEDPQALNRLTAALDPVLTARALNQVFKENREQIRILLEHLDAQNLSDLRNHLLRHNRPLWVALMTTVDHQALGAVAVEALTQDPSFFSKALAGLRPRPLSDSANVGLRRQQVFLSDFLGNLDMGSLAALIDRIAKEHPEFMNELVDKIIELIRKDFMKSGI